MERTTVFLFVFAASVILDFTIANLVVYFPLHDLRIFTLSGYWEAIKNVADSPLLLSVWVFEKCNSIAFMAWWYSPHGSHYADRLWSLVLSLLASLRLTRTRPPRGYAISGDEEATPLASRKERIAAVRARFKWGRWWVRRLHEGTLVAIGVKVLCCAVVGGLEGTRGHWSDVPLRFTWALVASTFVLTAVQRVALMGLMATWQKQMVTEAGRGVVADSASSLTSPLLDKEEEGEGTGTGEAGPNEAATTRSAAAAEEDKDAEKDLDELIQETSKNAATLGSLVRLSSQDWPLLTLAFTAGCAAAGAGAFVPFYLGQVINAASLHADRAMFLRTTLRMLLCACISGVFTGIRGGVFSYTMTRLNIRLRSALFTSLMSQEIGFFDTSRTGEITSRLSSDTNSLSDLVSLNVNVLLRSLVSAAMVLAFMFHASWRLNKLTLEELAGANSTAEEALSSMSTVRSLAAESTVIADYRERLHKYWTLLNQEAYVYAVYATFATIMPSATTASVLYFGGLLILEKRLSPGALVSFLLYQQSLTGSFQAIGDVLGGLLSALGSAEKVFELLNREPKIPPCGSFIPESGQLRGEIELRDVSFRYPGRPEVQVLTSLSLTVNAGEVVALVGASGGGKSSIIKLVERFYLPERGSVLLDGRDLGEYDHRFFKRQVGLVGQEPVLLARSIRQNILFGLENEPDCPTQEDVEEACRLANALDFIRSLPKGFETACGEKGVQLSGGQKQRVAIARALVRRPRVILLDEATSALDAESEAVVQEALDRLMQSHGHSMIVIAHRLSSVRNADRIVVIHGGAVAETGSHLELLDRPEGLYRKLVQKQLQGGASTASLSGAG